MRDKLYGVFECDVIKCLSLRVMRIRNGCCEGKFNVKGRKNSRGLLN